LTGLPLSLVEVEVGLGKPFQELLEDEPITIE